MTDHFKGFLLGIAVVAAVWFLGLTALLTFIGLVVYVVLGVAAYSFVDRDDVLFHWVLDSSNTEWMVFRRLLAWPAMVPWFYFSKDWKPKQ